MNRLVQLAHNITAVMVRNRARLPWFMNRLIDDVAKNPDGITGRLASILLGGGNARQAPDATEVPSTPTRVYIGSTNYSGQGHRWAQALMEASPTIGARNMAVELPSSFVFPADTQVPVAVYNRSKSWQQAELQAVSQFSHVLIEAERPLFGSLFDRDVAHETTELLARGISVAYLCHGTDIRSPRRNLELTPWSPFADDPELTAVLQADADRNAHLLASANLPVFVSTPDLLLDVATAQWCPVVVESEVWVSGRPLLTRDRAVVAHIPSMGPAKGTHLIDGPMKELERSGMIDYMRFSGVKAAKMPSLVASADIVLDQFRVGSYGVAACEAMATGRVVVGHVLPSVRDYVRESTGLSLPVVEATPDTVAEVVAELALDRDRLESLSADGIAFVQTVHSGALSAAVLRRHWIDRAV